MALNDPRGYNPWQGHITSEVTPQPIRLYRVCGGGADPEGAWLTPMRPVSSAKARRELALPPTNSATEVVEVWVPAGVRIQSGTAAPNWGQPGGGPQVELLQRI